MKNNILLAIIFSALILYAFSSFQNNNAERIGGTQLNDNGFGCACHNISASERVQVWIDGPAALSPGESAEFKMFLTGGPAVAGGYNVAVRFGKLNFDDTLSVLLDNELTQKFPLEFPSINDTIFWPFIYTALDSSDSDTIYSTGLSVNNDGIPTELDEWNYGPKFTVNILKSIPVELISFYAEKLENNINLLWSTATEKNNKGFEIERLKIYDQISGWKKIGYTGGSGTTTKKKYYSFLDENIEAGNYKYRLKQIDYSGTFSYSKEIETKISHVEKFQLYQNYPNPFNPSTKIKFTISESGPAYLKIYDALGKEIAVLLNEGKQAGEYELTFNGAELPSGIYILKFQSGLNSDSKKMVLIK